MLGNGQSARCCSCSKTEGAISTLLNITFLIFQALQVFGSFQAQQEFIGFSCLPSYNHSYCSQLFELGVSRPVRPSPHPTLHNLLIILHLHYFRPPQSSFLIRILHLFDLLQRHNLHHPLPRCFHPHS